MDKYIFIGNRYFVLEKLIRNNCKIEKIYAVKESFLSQKLDEIKIKYHTIESKQQLIDSIKNDDYDILVSNGCPYILPISELRDGKKIFINIHPSLLPDLKGRHPINGAVLYNRTHGVTCHYMDDGIDTGQIIEQMEIPITDDLNIDLLYQISFRAEGIVFENSLKNGFKAKRIECNKKTLYYSRKDSDLFISLVDSLSTIQRKVKAFAIEGLYARIIHNNNILYIKSVTIIENKLLETVFPSEKENVVLCKYGIGFVLVKLQNRYLQIELKDVSSVFVGEELITGNYES